MLFPLEIIYSLEIGKGKVYIITLASKDEIKSGEYIQINNLKISQNPKKFGMITNIGETNEFNK